MMKAVLRSTVLWLLLALLLAACQPVQRLPAAVTTGLVSQAADAASPGVPNAGQPLPFKGTLEAVEQQVVEPPTLYVNASGSGHATEVGAYTVTYTATVNLPDSSAVVSMELVAANGDTILAEGRGQGSDTDDPDVAAIEENYTITGGTGRFAGAGGEFTVKRLVNLATGVTSGEFEGELIRSK
jgi:hypothetical protein